jgi:hypothetical protein
MNPSVGGPRKEATMRKVAIVSTVILMLAGRAAADEPLIPLPNSGSMTWFDWTFDYSVGDEYSEGLQIKNVHFKGTKVLDKGSMPVVRVKYRGDGDDLGEGCGPYTDQIDWCNIEYLSGAITRVVARIFDDTLLEVAIFAEIGGYDLYQAWYFDKSGRLQPMLYSSGWSCCDDGHENDHKHHPYWRLDFDVETLENQVWQTDNPSSASPTFTRKDLEANASRTSGNELAWKVKKSGSSKHVLIQYPGNELRDSSGAVWFSFSNKDAAWRRYRSSENVGWDDFDWDEHLGYKTPPESTNKKDIVFWVVGHLTHTYDILDVVNPQWHSTGPIIDLKNF